MTRLDWIYLMLQSKIDAISPSVAYLRPVPTCRDEALMELLAQNLLNGLTIGAFYALVALGYTMVYGVLKLINFAHGDLFMWGAYLGWTFLTLLAFVGFARTGPWALVPTVIFVMITVGLVGVLLERVAYRPLRGTGRLPPVISALGAAFILESAARNLYGASYPGLPSERCSAGAVRSLRERYRRASRRCFVLVASIILMALLVRLRQLHADRHGYARGFARPRHFPVDGHRRQPHYRHRFLPRPGVGRRSRHVGGLALRLVQLHPRLDVRPQSVHRRDPRRHRQHPRRHAGRHYPGQSSRAWAQCTWARSGKTSSPTSSWC